MKLDRLIARLEGSGRSAARRLIAAGRVRIDGEVITRNQHEIDRFMAVAIDGRVARSAERALHLMLHKPAGVLSATVDRRHPTVLDLIDHPGKHTLHLVGRLDRASSGLMLLTNDGRWSKRLMDARFKVPKSYLVETRDPITPDAVSAFARGIHLLPEDIVTLPVEVEIVADRIARLTLLEGRHHQIKRMFGRLENRVTRLHREGIGSIRLPRDLAPGCWRHLSEEERSCGS